MPTSKVARLERDGDLAIIVFNNPSVKSITVEARLGLRTMIDELEGSSGIKAAILMCEGTTFFSGADIGEFKGPPKEEEYRALFNAIEALEIPVIAAMHGTVLGGGLEIALACHYRVAAPKARF